MSLKEDLKAWIEASKISQARAAGQIGISAATLSSYLKGTYTGNTADIDVRVKSFLHQRKEKSGRRTVARKFVETTTTENIFSIAKKALYDGAICVCTGDAGVGKTVSLHRFAAENPNVILLEIDPSVNAQVLFTKINEELGGEGRQILNWLFDDCVRRLKNSERLIIIDEAEHLRYRALEQLRRLHDMSGVGLLLVGENRLVSNLLGARGEFRRLYSRVSGYCKLQKTTEEEVEKIAHAYMLDASDEVVSALFEQCKGNVRSLINLVNIVMDISTRRDIPATRELVDKCARSLII